MDDQNVQPEDNGNDIAVIGMAGRFPSARDLRAFWRNLREGVDSISFFSPNELERSPLVPEEVWNHPAFVRAGGILEGADLFDHGFFDIPLREAQWMDPQQRLFLQCAWAALEDAAYDPSRFSGRISLYAGAGASGHLLSLLGEARKDPGAGLDLATSGPESVAMKTSFKLQLRGESVAVYTACSTGLVAIHMACQSLLTRQSDIALAGAVRIASPQRTGYVYQEGLIYSPDGHCRAFDHRAAGTVASNGVGVVVLKPLADALRDGDHIHAVIKGSAINNDGNQKAGYTAPSVEGQAEVIADALAYAGLEGEDIQYVEAHGTGTSLGDPIEVAALTRAFRKTTERRGFCGLGSLKTNLGHMDAAAGVAGLIKVALALKNEELPPSLHFERPNPEIDFERSPFFVNTALKPWPRGEVPRRAGVSSFGIGGTNAHVVLEEAPVLEPAPTDARPQRLVTLSARTPTALEAMARELASHVEAEPGVALANVAFTRNVGRRAFEYRQSVVAADAASLVERLRQLPAAVETNRTRRVAFLFPGQGVQTVGMGRELHAAEPGFRKDVEAALARLEPSLGAEVRALLLPAAGQEEIAARKLVDPRVALPALFIVEHALARLWMSWGVKPHAMLGHSYGEYVVACVAGVLSLEDGLRLAVARGALMARMPPGAMLSVGMEEAELLPLLADGLTLAAVNGPGRCVVSGPVEAIERLEQALSGRGVGVVRLPAAHAFHSSAVEPLMPDLARVVSGLRLQAPKLRYVSSLTGTWIRAEEVMDPAYWARQMRQPVRFSAGLEVLLADGCSALLEVGPGQDLTSLCRPRVRQDKRLISVPSLRRRPSESDYAGLLRSVGELWSAGVDVDWSKLHAGGPGRRIPLPTYPFEEKSCSLQSTAALPVLESVPSAATPTAPVAAKAPVGTPAPAPVAAPRSEIERRVMEIWRERLGSVEIGPDDDFLELGGNSLMAAQMLTRLRETFSVQLPLGALFDAPTVRGISAHIETLLQAAQPTGPVAPEAMVRIDRTGELPLSIVQERVWRMEQREPGNPALNMPLAIRISGALDAGLLERSINEVIRRHEMLRATYTVVDGRVRQGFAPLLQIKVPVVELRNHGGDREAEAMRLALEEAERPFSLEREPIVRARLLRLAASEYLLLLTVHHIAADTLSLVAFVREAAVNYQAFRDGKPAPLPELAVQYVDYASWERRSLAAGALAEQEAYWREVLAELPGSLELASDRPRSARQQLRGVRFPVSFTGKLGASLIAFNQRERVTSFATLLAALSALLSRYSGREDIVVGTPIGNRAKGELEPLIGFVAHAIALRTDLSGDPTFRELLGRARDVTIGASANQDVPFEHLLPQVSPGRDPGQSRLCDAALVLHADVTTAPPPVPGLDMRLVEVPGTPAQFGATLGEMTLLLTESAQGFTGFVEYATDLYDEARIARLVGHLETLLAAVIENPELRLSRLPLATPAEQRSLLLPAQVDATPGLLARLAARVERSPETVAISSGGWRLKWRELAACARGLAVRLRSEGVGPEVPVALRLEPSIEAVIALWGVLEAGGACLPVSSGELAELPSLSPAEGPRLLLVARSAALSPPAGVRVLTVDAELSEAGGAVTDAVPDERLAFIVPASEAFGGRGRLQLTHRNIARLLTSLDARMGAGEGEVWLAAGGPAADASGLDLLWALARGMRVVLPPERLAARFAVLGRKQVAHRPLEFSLSYFANDEDSLGERKYEMLIEGAKFADTHGFSAIWTPERRFHSFGGLYPAPSVISGALAMITRNLRLRAGSVVLPLHDPIEVAEQWSVVDNLSGGRVGLSFATGWHANDFSLSPDTFARRREVLVERLEEFRRLWRGETVRRRNGAGVEVELAVRPKPSQPEVPVWLTSAGNPETFRQAGDVGAGILTNVLGIGSNLDELKAKVALYREAWRKRGHGPGRGHVTLMLHTFLGRDLDEVRSVVREPLKKYFRSSVDIFGNLMASQGLQVDVRGLTEQDMDALLGQGVEHSLRDGGIFGSVEDGERIIERVRTLDVDEIACLVDFGVGLEDTMSSLRLLDVLRQRVQAPVVRPEPVLAEGAGGFGELLETVRSEGITALRCAPSQARALAELPGASEALGSVRRLVLGGEAVAPEAVSALSQAFSSERVELEASVVEAAWPGAGTGAIRLLDVSGAPVPVGVVGELAIGGGAVPRGFWMDPEATRARFISAPGAGADERLFLTGQRARYRVDGEVERVAPPRASKSRRPARTTTAVQNTQGTQKALASSPRVSSGMHSPVVRVSREQPLPLSFAQERLWFLQQLNPADVAYNNTAVLRLSGKLEIAPLEAALNEVVRRHEVLRSTYVLGNDGARQEIAPSMPLVLEHREATGESAAEREADVFRLARVEALRPFDLLRGPVMRAVMIRISESEHFLQLTLHHVASDAWSATVLYGELGMIYESFLAGRPSPLPELPVQYADYAVWQRGWLSGQAMESQLAYWKKQLAGVPVLELPTDRPRPATRSWAGDVYRFVLPRDVSEPLLALGRREGATSFMVMMALYQALLHRYSGQEDFAVGTPLAGRNRPELEGLIGCFINTLALRAPLAGAPSFRELLGRVRHSALEAYAHQDAPFERIVDVLDLPRDTSRTPVFQASINLINTPESEVQLPSLKFGVMDVPVGSSKFDLGLTVREEREGLSCVFEYATSLFDEATVAGMAGCLAGLARSVVESPEQPLALLPLLEQGEERRLLVEWNDTRAAMPSATVHSLFEAQVERTPEALAVVAEEARLTYRELNQRANQLAWHLRELGVGPDVPVGLFLERSVDALVGLWGILKAGGAYVPLDPAFPAERQRGILEDSGARALVTDSRLAEGLSGFGGAVVCLDTDAARLAACSEANPPSTVQPENLVYVIFTSGSTGRPKGVAIEHRQLVNYVQGVSSRLELPEGASFASVSTLAADLGNTAIFPTLCRGGALHFISKESASDPAVLARLLESGAVDGLKIVPAHLRALLDSPHPERVLPRKRLVLGGDVSDWTLMDRVHVLSPELVVFNHYGPTETTVGVLTFRVERGSEGRVSASVPLGRPIPNARVYVLDRHLQPVPVGVPGELCIGGSVVGRGYLGRPELTVERFVPDAFSDEPGARMYRTGDRVRLLADGRVEFLGRVDHQLKIRGYRVELGEVQAALERHPAVRDAVVVAREVAVGDKRLVAYVVPTSPLPSGEGRGEGIEGPELNPETVRTWLKQKLPEYMVPSAIVALEALPLTANGKVDRAALPAPVLDRLSEQWVAPRTPVEEVLAGLWSELLRVQRVGVNESFFELGGHSLLAMQLVARLRSALQVELPLREVFEAPTVAGLAERVQRALATAEGATQVPPLRRVPRGGSLPLSFAQERLWLLEQLDGGGVFYHIPMAVELTGRVDVAALERSLHELARRHEALRTRFVESGGTPIQIIEESAELPLVVESLDAEPGASTEAAVRQRIEQELRKPFELAKGRLARALLLKLEPERHVLLLVVHHILSDGWSMGVLTREVVALYAAFAQGQPSPLAELPVQYADYAVWQREWLRGEVLESQLDWWREQLQGAPHVLELPEDRPRRVAAVGRAERRTTLLPLRLVERLEALARGEGATLFMAVLAGLQMLLSRYSGQKDLLIGVPFANRGQVETEGLLGLFFEPLVLRADLSGRPGFRELLRRAKKSVLGAFTHPHVPFEPLLKALGAQRNVTRAPLFQVLFAHVEAIPEPTRLPGGVGVRLIPSEPASTELDLTVMMTRVADGVVMSVLYNAELYDAERIERMLEQLQVLLESAVEAPDRAVETLPLLKEAERNRLLVEWNGGRGELPGETCVHTLFEEQVARTPEAVAVKEGNRTVSYRELDARAAQLARHLREQGVGAEVRVGVCVERSVEMVVALLGVLKAGGAYVPLDAEYPVERLRFMLEDSGAKVVVARGGLRERLGEAPGRVWLEVEEASRPVEGAPELKVKVPAEAGAYVLYTSGSTGKPKGVVVQHRSLVNFVRAAWEAFPVEPGDRVLQFASVSWDTSAEEVYPCLTRGGTLVLRTPEMLDVPEAFLEKCEAAGVTQLNLPTAFWHEVVASLEEGKGKLPAGLKWVVIGGERVVPERVAQWRRRVGSAVPLLNTYGLTEVTAVATAVELTTSQPEEAGREVAIGRPLKNVRVYVLDGEMEVVPEGVVGELYVGGEGLARGYQGRAELTAERFVPSPFGEGERLYRTGDRARWRKDGSLEYLGRGDEQVKVRGHRIELGEVEAGLLGQPGVREALVVVREDVPGDKRLVAYAVAKAGQVLEGAEVRAALGRKLPAYLVPQAVVVLEQLPLQPNGKVDRKGLPAPEQAGSVQREYVAPRTPLEEKLAGFWAEVLRLEKVGLHDNFFDAGGHSLLAMQLVARVREAVGVELPLRAVFESPTLGGMADAVSRLTESTKRIAEAPIPRVSKNLDQDALEQLSDEELDALLNATESEN
ncbi:amino acid adenylation domain-containing protein [Archangium lansingense]|uniref:amino acid adenylation domain-containing protein n=1 Tax=Archangium lansingense TaxID=2995310 RepID=UPI003B7C27E9